MSMEIEVAAQSEQRGTSGSGTPVLTPRDATGSSAGGLTPRALTPQQLTPRQHGTPLATSRSVMACLGSGAGAVVCAGRFRFLLHLEPSRRNPHCCIAQVRLVCLPAVFGPGFCYAL